MAVLALQGGSMRKTSVDAYNYIIQSGILSKLHTKAYKVLYEKGPLTGRELSVAMELEGQWKRCSELKKRGLAIEVGERECSVTGMLAYVWDVTDAMPQTVEVDLSRKDKIKFLQEFIKNEGLWEKIVQKGYKELK